LDLNYIIKVFLFFLYVPYEQRCHDAKFNLEIFTLRNVIIIVVIVDFVRFKFLPLDRR